MELAPAPRGALQVSSGRILTAGAHGTFVSRRFGCVCVISHRQEAERLQSSLRLPVGGRAAGRDCWSPFWLHCGTGGPALSPNLSAVGGTGCVGRREACARVALPADPPLWGPASSFSPCLGHVCLRRVNFLVWWHGHLCFLCRPSGCVFISEPRLRESSWGSEPAHLTSVEPEARSSRPQLLHVWCLPVCLFLLHPNRG